jgi:hypothetical protein
MGCPNDAGTKNKIVQAGVSNCMHRCLNFFGTKRTHSRVPGLKGGDLFLNLDKYKFVFTKLYYITHVNYVIFLNTIRYV